MKKGDIVGQALSPAQKWIEQFVLRRLDNVKRYSNHPATVREREEKLNEIPSKTPNGKRIRDSLNTPSLRNRELPGPGTWMPPEWNQLHM